MKLKGVRKLNREMTKIFAKRFGIKSVKLSTYYAYFPTKESITFQIVECEENEWFAQYIEERFGYRVEYPFLISMLHEVGHHKTLDDLGENVYNFCQDEKDYIENMLQDEELTEEEQKKYEWQYFNLPDEIIATAWAVKYATKHPRIMKKLNKQIMELLQEFYKANDLGVD